MHTFSTGNAPGHVQQAAEEGSHVPKPGCPLPQRRTAQAQLRSVPGGRCDRPGERTWRPHVLHRPWGGGLGGGLLPEGPLRW